MRSHNVSKSGAVALALVGSIVLTNVDASAEKVRALGRLGTEVVCTAQSLTAGMVTIAQNCDAAASSTTEPTGSIDGDD